MKISVTFVLFAFLSFQTLSFAQETPSNSSPEDTELSEGAKFLEDSIGEDFQISNEPLTDETEILPFDLADPYRIVLASMRGDVMDIENDPELSAEEKRKRISEIENRMVELLEIYDQLIDYATVVTTFSIQIGAELPFNLTRFLFKDLAAFGWQGSLGITFAVTHNKRSGFKGFKKNVVVGVSSVSGFGLHLGKVVGTAGATNQHRFTGIFPAIIATFTLKDDENAPPLKLGDLQSTFYGVSVEFPGDTGRESEKARTVQLGIYLKPNSLTELPEHLMFYGFFGRGKHTKIAQVEALRLRIFAANDGSRPRLIPFIDNGTLHDHPQRVKRIEELREELKDQDLTPGELMDALRKRAQRANDANHEF